MKIDVDLGGGQKLEISAPLSEKVTIKNPGGRCSRGERLAPKEQNDERPDEDGKRMYPTQE